MLRKIAKTLILVANLVILADGSAEDNERAAERIVRSAGSFDRADFNDPADIDLVRQKNNLNGGKCCVSGLADYNISILDAGWYQLWAKGGTDNTGFVIDPPHGKEHLAGEQLFFGGSGVLEGGSQKIGNIFLSRGTHVLRVQSFVWHGFSDFRQIELRRSTDAVEESVRLVTPSGGRIFRVGECPKAELLYGPRMAPVDLVLVVSGAESQIPLIRTIQVLPIAQQLTRLHIDLPCSAEGFYRASVAKDSSKGKGSQEGRLIEGFDYEVVDVSTNTRVTAIGMPEPVEEIDCYSQAPDFTSGRIRVVERVGLNYRESDSIGWIPYGRLSSGEQKGHISPSWFAYNLTGIVPGDRYIIDIYYPDDADRTFGILFRESKPNAYPVSVGVDTGGPIASSNKLQTATMIVWPKTRDPRLLFITAHDDKRAACSRIRVSRLSQSEPQRQAFLGAGTREFSNWYEEGSNFPSLVGISGQEPQDISRAVSRWADIMTMGSVTTLIPTVVVYGSELYPSDYNRTFSRPDRDVLRRLVLEAEKRHMKIIPELHPRADELLFGMDRELARRRLLISRTGSDTYFVSGGNARRFPPLYNILQAEVQDWVIGMIGELADSYRDSSALEGISLRYMDWANSGLDNLVSLEWGYDDETVREFENATGQEVPGWKAEGIVRYASRYTWLTTTGRGAWIEWRCARITDFMRRVSSRIRSARPDLKLYLNVFAADEFHPFSPSFAQSRNATIHQKLREIGYDVPALLEIPGLVLINSTGSYGRNRMDAVIEGLRDPFMDPELLNAMRPSRQGGSFIAFHRYLEATDRIAPPADLGMPSSTPATWASVAAGPPGRYALERYAIELAEADAIMLGDGGNGYVGSRKDVSEFMAEFTRLPSDEFSARMDAVDPVTVRTLTNAEGSYFYAVNREPFKVRVVVSVSGNAPWVRLLDGTELIPVRGKITFDLQAFGMIAALGKIGSKVMAIDAPAPAGEVDQLRSRLIKLQRISNATTSECPNGELPSDTERAILFDANKIGLQALRRGRTWHARGVLENSSILRILRRLKCDEVSTKGASESHHDVGKGGDYAHGAEHGVAPGGRGS